MSSFSQNMERTFSENEMNTLSNSGDNHGRTVCCEETKLILNDIWLEVIKFLALLKLILTDFCNVLWGLKEMYRWNHHIKCTIYGGVSIGLTRYYILDPLQDNYIVYYPLSFIAVGCLLKIGSYANNYMINNPDSAVGSKAGKDYPLSPLDQHKFRKSQYYLGFSPLNPDDEVRMEFAKGLKEGISDWWINRSCDSDNLGTKNVMCDTLLCPTHKGSGTKEDPIDLTENNDEETNDLDDVDSGSDSDDSDDSDESDDSNDSIVHELEVFNLRNSVDLNNISQRPTNPTPVCKKNKKVKAQDYTVIRLKNTEKEDMEGKNGAFLRYKRHKITMVIEQVNPTNYTKEGNARFDEMVKNGEN